MSEENTNVVNSTTNAEQTAITNEPKVAEPFSELQQAKVNSLIKEEKYRYLNKLGVNSFEEAKAQIENAKELETYKEKATKYDEAESRLKELEGENAMLKIGISEDMREIVKGYFKGIGKDLTKDNIEETFKTNPKLKAQWLETQNIPNVNIGNPAPEKSPSDLDGFYKYTRYKN